MQYRGANYSANTWDTYWYEKNLFGDIVAVYGNDGTKLISYTYDAWGQCSTFYHDGTTSASPVAKNPFRYRGYYYDTDLNLYYLQTRYYDSNTGRFINVDSALYHNMLGYNMFVYCNNNPTNCYDPNGKDTLALLWGWISSAGSVALSEPTPIGEIIVSAGAILLGGVYVGEKLVDGIEYIGNLFEEDDDPPQSIIEQNKEAEVVSPTINEAKASKKDSKYQGKKVAPRIKFNSKKAARENAFIKGGKRPPIHHANGKFGPHFHPNNPKFSHWHYYYIVIFSVGQSVQER